MSMHGENVDRSAIDKENLDYFKTLIRHLQRIPDNKILLFRQEVDALLLKYAHHYVQNNEPPVAMARETKRRRYESTDSESEESEPLPTAKVDKRKSKVGLNQGKQQKKLKKSKPINLSDDDEIEILQTIKKPVTSIVKEESAKDPVKIERNISTPAQNHQEAAPRAAPTGPSHSGTPIYEEQYNHHRAQPCMDNNYGNFNNSTRQAPVQQQQSYEQQRMYNDNSTRQAPVQQQQSYEQQRVYNAGGYNMPPSNQQNFPDNRVPYSGHYDYNSSQREMPPGLNPPPPAQYRHPSAPHPPQYPTYDQNRQVVHQSPVHPYNQQHPSSAGFHQEPNWQNAHPPQHDYVHGAPSTSAQNVFNTSTGESPAKSAPNVINANDGQSSPSISAQSNGQIQASTQGQGPSPTAISLQAATAEQSKENQANRSNLE